MIWKFVSSLLRENSQTGFSLCSHTTSTTIINSDEDFRDWMCGVFSPYTKQWTPAVCSIQFSHYLPRERVRSHRLGAQSPRLPLPPPPHTPVTSSGLWNFWPHFKSGFPQPSLWVLLISWSGFQNSGKHLCLPDYCKGYCKGYRWWDTQDEVCGKGFMPFLGNFTF